MADDSSGWSAVDSLLGDRYTREARIAPAFLCVFPILILLMAWFKGLQGAVPALLSLLCVFGVVRWISHIARSVGDQIEIGLFQDWGGKPTTSMLRFALKRVKKIDELRLFRDPVTDVLKTGRAAKSAARVAHLLHESPRAEAMQELIAAQGGPGFPPLDEDKRIEESQLSNDPKRANDRKADLLDSLYEPVVAWMRENLRDKKLVAEEEISYGCQRNFYALKKFALGCIGAAFVVQLGVIAGVYHWGHHAWAMKPPIAAVILIANVLYLIGVAKFVSEDSVMVQGFIYARALFDALYAADSPGAKDGDHDNAAPAKKH